ncbi:MAG: toxin-antitoxin system HicB family antitoxin [Sciscionella sp.]
MDLTPYLATLREDLTTAASAGDEQTRRAAAVLAAALEPSARLAIMNALADLAAEVTAQLDDHVVEVRLAGRELNVVVTGSGSAEQERPAEEQRPPPRGDGDISRITVRLFEELKTKAEQAAASQGVSLNSFVAQAVNGALRGARSDRGGGDQERTASRVQGWVQG